jgi:hypothetical protein
MACAYFTKYKGKKAPRCGCSDCWAKYINRMMATRNLSQETIDDICDKVWYTDKWDRNVLIRK